MNRRTAIITLLFFLALFAALDEADREHQELQQDHYCTMVDLNRESNGELGWPDYERTYDQYCKGDNNDK